jgi:hypothetical protein
MRFQCNFLVFDIENDIENAIDIEKHIQTANPKRKCNRPLKERLVNSPPDHIILEPVCSCLHLICHCNHRYHCIALPGCNEAMAKNTIVTFYV